MAESAAPAGLPAGKGLRTLRHAAASCRACPLWKRATQTVFGEGPIRAGLFLIGEQPGGRDRPSLLDSPGTRSSGPKVRDPAVHRGSSKNCPGARRRQSRRRAWPAGSQPL